MDRNINVVCKYKKMFAYMFNLNVDDMSQLFFTDPKQPKAMYPHTVVHMIGLPSE